MQIVMIASVTIIQGALTWLWTWKWVWHWEKSLRAYARILGTPLFQILDPPLC